MILDIIMCVGVIGGFGCVLCMEQTGHIGVWVGVKLKYAVKNIKDY